MVRLFNILDYRARLAQRSVAALDGLGYARKPAERVRSVLRSTREDKKYPQRRILIDTASYQTPEPKAIRYRIVRSGDGAPNTRRMSGGQVKDENASQDWVPAGLAELARGGIDGVRVELLAERLGITKGGFYRRFKDRRALLDAMLETWRDGRVTAIERQAEASGGSAVEKLRGILQTVLRTRQHAGHGDRTCDTTMGAHRSCRRSGRCDGGRGAAKGRWLALSEA